MCSGLHLPECAIASAITVRSLRGCNAQHHIYNIYIYINILYIFHMSHNTLLSPITRIAVEESTDHTGFVRRLEYI